MLQIATGKLFTRPASRENRLRGMLYTNAIFTREDAVETAVGRLFPSSSYSIRPSVLVFTSSVSELRVKNTDLEYLSLPVSNLISKTIRWWFASR